MAWLTQLRHPAGSTWSPESNIAEERSAVTQERSTRGQITVSQREPVDLEVVIPALNEERRIGRSVRAIVEYLERRSYTSAVVVVDNGCVDGTADIVSAMAANSPVAVHLINCSQRGKGAAVRRGILSSRARYVGFCDADLATPIETLETVWRLLERGAPVVIGSRYCPGGSQVRKQALRRRLGSSAFRLLVEGLLPGIYDTQCGFKFFSAQVAWDLFSRCTLDGFAFDVEILAMARVAGLPVVEVPVAWSDGDGSTFRSVHDGVASVADVLALAWSWHSLGRPITAGRAAAGLGSWRST